MEGISGVLKFTSHVTLGTKELVPPVELAQSREIEMEMM